MRVLRVPCTGRIDFMMVLKALHKGADGVIVSGCHPNDCHYTSGNYHARRRWMVFKKLMEVMGVDMRRITFSWVSAAEGAQAGRSSSTRSPTRSGRLGPYQEYRQLVGAGIE